MVTADPRRLSFLLAVNRSGGILAGAELLGVTPSAVSQQISRLEAEQGFAVLERNPRGVTLTPAGRVLVDAAERIEAELVQAQKAIAALGDGTTGRVVVGAFQTAIRAVIVPLLGPLAERYPAIDLEITEHDPGESIRMLRSGEIDIVMLERDAEVDAAVTRGIAEVPLLDEPWRLVIPAGMAVPQQLSDLNGLTFVSGAEGTAADRALQRIVNQHGITVHKRHHTFDFDTTLALVGAGQGVALLPALALPSQPQREHLSVVRLAGLGGRRIYLKHRSSRREPTPAVQSVVELMVEVARGLDL